MTGLAERYWDELRPSTAGRYQFDVRTRSERAKGRNLRRPRRRVRSKLRTAPRSRTT